MRSSKYKTLALEGLSMPRLLQAARRTEALYLTLRGVVRHVIMAADDGDQEVCAMKNNAKLMAHLEKMRRERSSRPDEIARRGSEGTRFAEQETEKRPSPRPRIALTTQRAVNIGRHI